MKKACFEKCYETIGKRISDERKKLGITQHQLARYIGGFTAPTISKIERGEYFHGDYLRRIRHVCEELNIEEFFDQELDKARTESYKDTLKNQIRGNSIRISKLAEENLKLIKELESL